MRRRDRDFAVNGGSSGQVLTKSCHSWCPDSLLPAVMEVTLITWIVGVAGLLLMGLLTAVELVAVIKPRSEWTIENIYGGDPSGTDPKAYFA